MVAGLWIALAMSATSNDGIADAVSREGAAPLPASAVTFGPLSAASPDGRLRAVIVGSYANAEVPRSTHALIACDGEVVLWVALPFDEIPSSVVAPNASTMHCVFPGVNGAGEIATLDAAGLLQGRTSFEDVLPVGGLRAQDQIVGLGYSGEGPCMAVPLACGSVALVDFDLAEQDYGICSLIRPEKHSYGVDAWLKQAHVLTKEGDQSAARYAFEAAIETDPTDARTYREFSNFLERQNQDEDRLACLRLGVDRLYARADGPVTGDWAVGTPSARLVVDFLQATRKIEGDAKCHTLLDEALALYPCMEQVVLMRAELLLEEDEDEAAIYAIDHALALIDPNSDLAAAHHDVGRFLRRHKRDQMASRYLEDAYALGDRSEFLLRGLAGTAEDSGDYLRAIMWLEELAGIWRGTHNGESAARRSARGAARLAGLGDEIDELHERALAAASSRD